MNAGIFKNEDSAASRKKKMNKKRILFISDSIFSAPTGVSNVAINIVTELVKDFNLFLLGVNLSEFI